MPPRIFSRYSFTAGIEDDDEHLVLTRNETFGFEQRDDNRTYTVGDGDTLFHLASKFFVGFTDRPAGLWWVIADYQPEPIHDPTVRLDRGRVIVIPSVRTVVERIFSEARRGEAFE